MRAKAQAIAVITDVGGALGQALAIALARRGVLVAGIVSGVVEGDSGPVLRIFAEVSDPADVARAFDEIRTRLGAPTILVNTAEVYPDRDILDETPASFMATVATNLGGAFNCCHAVLPSMIETGRGRIINVVTFADVMPAALASGYSVSKGALRILTRSLVADLGIRFPGIVINDWIPGTHAPRRNIADGVDPSVAAEWGANLALMDAPMLNGLVFLRDGEYRQRHSFRRRLKEHVLGQSRAPVRLYGVR
jgi:NAD(P)-dependent dehydrogenase (short-subunit alcohol dehydrogenase family)